MAGRRGHLLARCLTLGMLFSVEVGASSWDEDWQRQLMLPRSVDHCMKPSAKHGVGVRLGECNDGAGQRSVSAGFADGYTASLCDMDLPHAEEPSCKAECGPGQFLSADGGGAKCLPCPAGTFGIGGGMVLDHFAHMPPQLTTRCYRFDEEAWRTGGQQNAFYWKEGWAECHEWQANGTYISSGNNQYIDNVESYIFLHLRFVKKGTLWFTFEIDAEQYADGLIFRMDNENMPLDSTGGVLASSSDRRTVTFDVSPGWHIFKWIYIKDFSNTVTPDLAKIYEIGFNGTDYAMSQCQPCRSGATSEEGSERCGICPFGHAYAEETSSCEPCPEDAYALPGFSECRQRAPCTAEDWEVEYTPCKGGKRGINYKWVVPKVCGGEGGVSLPVSEEGVECAKCPPGTFTNDDGGCLPCGGGTYSKYWGQGACEVCPAGHEAAPGRVFHFRQGWPEGTSTEGGGGMRSWRVVKEGYAVVAAGTREGEGDAWIDFKVAFATRQARQVVTVEYELGCGGGSRVSLSASGSTHTLPCGEGKLTHVYNPPKFSHQLRIAFTAGGAGSVDERAKLHEVRVSGLEDGGAHDCTACPTGYHATKSNTKMCLECAAGHTNNADKRTCVACAPGTFSPVAGGSKGCMQCGNNTVSGYGATACSSDCVYRSIHDPSLGGSGEYNLKTMTAQGAAGPLLIDVQEEGSSVPIQHQVMLSICNDLPLACGSSDRTFACSTPTLSNGPDGTTEGSSSAAAAGFSLGSVMSFLPLEGEMDDTFQNGVTVEYRGGDSCGHSGRTWSTQIHIHCDLSAGLGAPVATHADNCVYHFAWFSQHGCPVCTADSFTMVGTQCVGGYHDVSYHTEERCYGGVPKPEDRKNAPCHDQLRDAMPAWAIALVVGGCLAISLFIASLAYQFFKYRRLYSRYQQVGGLPVKGAGGRSGGAEMDTFEIADDD